MKKWTCLALVMLMIALVGCGDVGVSSSVDSTPTSGSASQQIPAAVEPLYPHGQLRFYDFPQGIHWWYSTSLNTNAGLYELKPESPICHLWLTDYTTRECGILCKEPGCTHSDETCPAWLPEDAMRYNFLEAAGGLVLVDKGEREYIFSQEGHPPTEGVFTPPTIYTMGHDGKNRTLLCTFDEGELLENGWFTDDAYLYGVRDRYSEDIVEAFEGYPQTRTVIKVDLVTGESTDLCELAIQGEYFKGVLDGKLLTMGTEYPVDGAESRILQYTIDTNTGERTNLPKEYPNVGFGHGVLDGEYYYYNALEDFVNNQGIESVDSTPQSVNKVHLPTRETTQVFTGEEGKNVNTEEIMDGKLLVSVASPNTIEDDREYWWVDLATGEQTKLALYYTPAIYLEIGGDTRVPVTPWVEAGEHYLVVTGQRELEDGTLIPETSLILKEDYWAGKKNYLPIIYVA